MNNNNDTNNNNNNNLKRRMAIALLQSSPTVFLHINCKIDTTHKLVLPLRLLFQKSAVLQIGRDMPVPIPDLNLDQIGVTATLSFKGVPFTCKIPWEAVFGMVDESGRGKVWEADAPTEEALEGPKQATPPAAAPQETNLPRKGKRTFPDYLRLVK